MVADPAQLNVTQFGDYTVKEQIGEGGMCRVFRARRDGAAGDCALKLLREDQRDNAEVRDLFVTEADLAMLLVHPNLIQTFDAGEFRGRYYIAMELIEGGTLGHLAQRARHLGIELPVDLVLFVVSEVLKGLHALHTAVGRTGRPLGLVHRDITPHNIFLCFDGRVVLGDFGVAHIQAYHDTETSHVLGKIGYLAPETVHSGEVDLRSDLFSIGVVLYELLTGQRAFVGERDEEIMNAILEVKLDRPTKLRDTLDKMLEQVIMRSLSRKPRERQASAEALLTDLGVFWSPVLGNTYALSAVLSALFRDEASAWRDRHAGDGKHLTAAV
jgi:serine/threonine protein kinase